MIAGMRKIAFGLLLLPACFAYACSGSSGGEVGNNEDGGPGGGNDATMSTDGTTGGGQDGTVTDSSSGSDTGSTTDSGGSTDGGTDAGKDSGPIVYGFPIPEGGAPVVQFAGVTLGDYNFLDGVQWLPMINKLVLSDVDNPSLSGTSYTYAIDAGAPVMSTSTALNGNIPIGNAIYLDAGYLTCIAKDGGLVLTTYTGDASVYSAGFGGNPFNQPNDAVVRSDGYVYVTDPDYNGDRQADTHIYLIRPDGGTSIVSSDTGHVKFNGIALSPDQKTLYVSITDANLIQKYAVNTDGTLGTPTPFIVNDAGSDAGTHNGNPDGLAVDDAGNVYVGVTQGVEVYNPSGVLLGSITISGRTVSSIAFGGPDRRTLFIATNNGLGAAAGDDGKSALYRMYMNVPGGPTK
jgi:gluconolactonase